MNNKNLKSFSNEQKKQLVIGKKIKIIEQKAPHIKNVNEISPNNWDKIQIVNPWWNESGNLEQRWGDKDNKSMIYKIFYNYSKSRNDVNFFYTYNSGGSGSQNARWWYYPQEKYLKEFQDFAQKNNWNPQFSLWTKQTGNNSRIKLSEISINDCWEWSSWPQLREFARPFINDQKILDQNGKPQSKEALEFLKWIIGKSSYPNLDIIYQEGAELDGTEFIYDEIKNDIIVTFLDEEAKSRIDEQKLAEKDKKITELQNQLKVWTDAFPGQNPSQISEILKKQTQLKEDYNNLLIQLKELTEALAKSKEKTDQDKADEIIKLNQRIEILQKMLTGGPGSQQPTDDEANQEKIIAANIATATAQSQVAKLLERVGQLNEEVSRLKEQNTIAQVEMPAKGDI